MWKSTGRVPMRSPPTKGTKASPVRCSSGPSSRIGIRLSPENDWGTEGSCTGPGATVTAPSSVRTSAPSERRMSAVMATSPTSGALSIVLGPAAMNAATMCLVTAFFEPRTRTSPRSGPTGSTCQAGVLMRRNLADAPPPQGHHGGAPPAHTRACGAQSGAERVP